MTTWPVGLSTGCFHRMPLVECLETIRQSGFSMVEVVSCAGHLDYRDPVRVREAAARADALGMEAYSFHAPFADDIDISSPNRAAREHAEAEILRAADAAALLGVHYFVLHPGPENSEIPAPAERVLRIENTCSVLERVAAHCAKAGIQCVLENKLPHLMFGQSADLLWILACLTGNRVGACLDTGHAHLAGDLHPLIHKMAPYLRLLHVHDNKGRGDEHLPPGDGRIDWTTLLRELAGVRFAGALILELAGDDSPDVVMARARRSRTYLRQRARRIALHPAAFPDHLAPV